MTTPTRKQGIIAGAVAALFATGLAVQQNFVTIGSTPSPITISTGSSGGATACTGIPCAISAPAAVDNIWINTSAGATPSRCATACAYNATHAYGTFDAAYAAASHGDSIGVQCGNYGLQTITSEISGSGAQVTLQPVTNWCATLEILANSSGPTGDYTTWTGFKLESLHSGGEEAVHLGGSSFTYTNWYFFHNHVEMDTAAYGHLFNIHSCNGCKLDWNTLGPALLAGDFPGPEGMRFGAASGQPDSTNVEIRGNIIQSNIREAADWPATFITVENTTPQSAGAAPGPGCTDHSMCHPDGIHLWAFDNSTLSQNWVLNVGCQGIFAENQNGTIANLNIINNFVSTNQGVDVCQNDIVLECRNAGAACGGTYNIKFNTTIGHIEILDGSGGSFGTTVVNLTGNIGQFFSHGSDGAGCQNFDDSGFSAVYTYNVVVDVGGGNNVACGTGDVYTTSMPSIINGAFNMHLNAPGVADNLVPPSICTAITTLDADGQTRPINTNCDAGADER